MTIENKSTLLVTGASGFVGSRLGSAAAETGHRVIALSRTPETVAAPYAERVEAWRPDTELVPSSVLNDIGAVVHLAGETIGTRWNPDKKQRIRDSRVNSTNQLVESLSKVETKPEVLVCASAIGFYGDSGDEEFTEDSPPGNDFLAEVCQDWELAAQKAEDARNPCGPHPARPCVWKRWRLAWKDASPILHGFGRQTGKRIPVDVMDSY